MSVMAALRSAITTGLRLPFGVGLVGASGLHGRTFAKRIRSVHRLAERVAGWYLDPAAAREIAQDVSVAVWEKLAAGDPSFDGSRAIGPIIFTMTRQRVIKRAQNAPAQWQCDALHLGDRTASVHTWMNPQARLEEIELAELETRIAARLSRAEFEVFTLSREDGLSYREIAERLGKTLSTVRKQMMSAIAVYREECRVAGVPAPPPRRVSKRVVKGDNDAADDATTLENGDAEAGDDAR